MVSATLLFQTGRSLAWSTQRSIVTVTMPTTTILPWPHPSEALTPVSGCLVVPHLWEPRPVPRSWRLILNPVLMPSAKTNMGKGESGKKKNKKPPTQERSCCRKQLTTHSGKLHQHLTFPIIPPHLCQQVCSFKQTSHNKALLLTNGTRRERSGRGIGSTQISPSTARTRASCSQPRRASEAAAPGSGIQRRRTKHLKIRRSWEKRALRTDYIIMRANSQNKQLSSFANYRGCKTALPSRVLIWTNKFCTLSWRDNFF